MRLLNGIRQGIGTFRQARAERYLDPTYESPWSGPAEAAALTLVAFIVIGLVVGGAYLWRHNIFALLCIAIVSVAVVAHIFIRRLQDKPLWGAKKAADFLETSEFLGRVVGGFSALISYVWISYQLWHDYKLFGLVVGTGIGWVLAALTGACTYLVIRLWPLSLVLFGAFCWYNWDGL